MTMMAYVTLVYGQRKRKTIDWRARWEHLEKLCDKYRARNKGKFDVIVPYSGGKNGAYIAYILKEKNEDEPLCVTIRPPMEDPIGLQNIKNFQDRGYDHLFITPNRLLEREIDKDNFINKGIPMHAFMIAVQTAIMRTAVNFDIPFVMYMLKREKQNMEALPSLKTFQPTLLKMELVYISAA